VCTVTKIPLSFHLTIFPGYVKEIESQLTPATPFENERNKWKKKIKKKHKKITKRVKNEKMKRRQSK
jgi:hypothetical protein